MAKITITAPGEIIGAAVGCLRFCRDLTTTPGRAEELETAAAFLSDSANWKVSA